MSIHVSFNSISTQHIYIYICIHVHVYTNICNIRTSMTHDVHVQYIIVHMSNCVNYSRE